MKDECNLPETHDIAVGKSGGLQRLVVQKRAICAAQVGEYPSSPLAAKLGVLGGDGLVDNSDIGR